MMHSSRSAPINQGAQFSFWLLVSLLAALWVVGGASRADVLGQAITRFVAWSALIAFVLISPRFEWRNVKHVAVFLAIAVGLCAVQLVPLPPSIWTALPGREIFMKAADLIDEAQPWRPLSISPSATSNSLGSLIVPIAVLVLLANLRGDQHRRLVFVLIVLILGGCLLALLQFSGVVPRNPFINQGDEVVSGNFANRNHFALFVAVGVVLSLTWGFGQRLRQKWKVLASLAILPFLMLVMLASGSRTGILLVLIALGGGLLAVRENLISELKGLPRRTAVGVVAGTVIVSGGIVGSAVWLGRAVSIDRALSIDANRDLRGQSLPHILDMVWSYFPAGAGYGTFDPAFRLAEPDNLLQLRYLNHAHNDWLELVLDGGLAAAIFLAVVVGWYLYLSFSAWRRSGGRAMRARAASVVLLLIMLASVPDYPARTPMIMALGIIAAVWLSERQPESAPKPSKASFTSRH